MANIVNKYITNNPYYNDGKWLTGSSFKGFFLHSVGCSQPNPLVFINNWNKSTYTNAGINGFIGEDVIYITAPCLETKGKVKRMPHGGKAASNNYYIGFEMCEPSTIKYTSGANFTITNKAAAQAFAKKTYNNAVQLFAKLCTFHCKNPLEDGVILSHNEAGKRGIASGHVDPEHLWRGLGLSYTMDGFRKDVYNMMKGKDEIDMTKDEVVKLIDERIKAALEGKNTSVSSWAEKEFAEAIELGITDGSRPLGYATRQEAAIMVKRSVKK